MLRKFAIYVAGLVVGAIAFAVSTESVQAQECKHPLLEKLRPERLIPKTDPAMENTQCRAGHPDCVACYAQPSKCGPYSGSYVGGSCAWKGCARKAHEGTWGWDYCGPLVSEHPWLKWCDGRRCQQGTGAYKTDGPEVPDPIAKTHI